MRWMARHRPEIYAATRFVLTPKDYCLRALAGVAVSDPMSNFFIVGKTLAYLEPLLARVEGAQERLAPLRAFTDVVGEIAGVQRQTRARRGGHDGRLERPVRRGRPRARTRAYMSGTSEILAAASRERGGAPGVVSFSEAAGLNIRAGPTQSDGDSLRWSGQTVGADVAGVLALAGQADRAGRPLLFLPHLEGERAPLWDPHLRGAFIGIESAARGPDFALAALEGVALSARWLLQSIDAATGAPPPRLFHAGGGARSDLWTQIRADCLGRPLDRGARLDVGCRGDAIMASVGIGRHARLSAGVAAMTRVERIFEPNPRLRSRCDAMFEAYMRSTEALRSHGRVAN